MMRTPDFNVMNREIKYELLKNTINFFIEHKKYEPSLRRIELPGKKFTEMVYFLQFFRSPRELGDIPGKSFFILFTHFAETFFYHIFIESFEFTYLL